MSPVVSALVFVLVLPLAFFTCACIISEHLAWRTPKTPKVPGGAVSDQEWALFLAAHGLCTGMPA